MTRSSTLTIEEAKTIFFENSNCGLTALDNSWQWLRVLSIKPSFVWNNQLFSISESRSISNVMQPVNVQILGSKTSMMPPESLWDIQVDIPNDLEICRKKSFVMAFSSTLKTESCFRCKGKGHIVCFNCNGNGLTRCEGCCGNRHTMEHEAEKIDMDSDDEMIPNYNAPYTVDSMTETCGSCYGEGLSNCEQCDRKGTITCCECNGYGNMNKYTELNIQWSTLCDERYSHDCPLSSEFLRYCVGDVIYETKDCDGVDEVLTLQDCLNMEMIKASAQLIHEHRLIAMNGRSKIRKQKQVVSLIPLRKVEAEWKGKKVNYWIAGNNKKVYIPKSFPSKKWNKSTSSFRFGKIR